MLFFIPVIGFAIYLVFGRDSKKEKVFEDKAQDDREIYYEYQRHNRKYLDTIEEQKKSTLAKKLSANYKYLLDLIKLNLNTNNPITYDNKVEYFYDGKKKFEQLIIDIQNSKEYIHMEYYIIRQDEIGSRIIDELALAAKRGVEVKLLYDGMGCIGVNKKFFKKIVRLGGEVAMFLPPFIIRLNYRNHRKICIIDGQIGYIGGFNIGDEYMGKVKKFGAWRDAHIKIIGDAIDDIQLRFIMDWNFASSKKMKIEDRYFPKREPKGNVSVQIVSSGPDTKWKNIRNSYFKMINEAENNAFIVTPYFIPDDGILETLRVAAISNIDARIVIPAHPDHIFVYWASMSYIGELLEAGVRCYQYENGFIHSKVVFIDGKVSSVGSANMDIRSFGLNCEINAFIYNEDVTQMLESDFMDLLQDCTEITKEWYSKRSRMFKFKEAVSRLISPML